MTITITAEALAQTLFGCSAADLTRGQKYPGTNIPLRVVPADAVLTVEVQANGAGARVIDGQGEWISAHFGPVLGARQCRNLR